MLAHVDESRVVIPNRKIVGEILHNFGRIRQLEITVGVGYDIDFAAAEAVIDEVPRGNPRLLRHPPPLVQTARLTGSGVEMAIKPWVAISDYAVVTSEINKDVVETFRSQGIRFPLPQCEVQLLPRVSGLHPDRERLSA